jgi:hypothetical protein
MAPDHRSFEALAVIGSRLNLIYWIDKHWLVANAGRLFSLEGIAESPPMAQGWAAWNAFLVWVRPHIEFYKLFREQFAYAVEQSARVTLTEHTYEQPMYRLGEHLMILYGRGQLGLDDDGGLLRRFLSDSHPDVRRHAVGFVGRSLEGDEELPEEVIRRFQELWSIYWDSIGKQDAQEKPDAWLFGPWFSSGRFPAPWALEQLESFLEVTPTPEPEHAIAEQLAKIAQADIERAVRILFRCTARPQGYGRHAVRGVDGRTAQTTSGRAAVRSRLSAVENTHADVALTHWERSAPRMAPAASSLEATPGQSVPEADHAPVWLPRPSLTSSSLSGAGNPLSTRPGARSAGPSVAARRCPWRYTSRCPDQRRRARS